MKERRQCVCRGWIAADPDNLDDIAAAVQAHRATDQHQDADVVERLQGNRPSQVPSATDIGIRRELEHAQRPIDILEELRLRERQLTAAGR